MLVVPFALKEYGKDKGRNKWVKIINIIITFGLFYSFTNSLREEISLLFFNFDGFKKILYDGIDFLTPELNILFWVLYVILSFVLSANVVLLALRKEKSRVFFLWLIPVLWILKSIHLYNYFISHLEKARYNQAFVFVFTMIGIMCLIIYLLYSSKSFKTFFQYEQNSTADLK